MKMEDSSFSPIFQGVNATDDNEMKVERCMNFCRSKGSTKYAGLKSGDSCYCADVNDIMNLQNDALKRNDSNCLSSPCADNSAHACGGFVDIAVYNSKSIK